MQDICWTSLPTCVATKVEIICSLITAEPLYWNFRIAWLIITQEHMRTINVQGHLSKNYLT